MSSLRSLLILFLLGGISYGVYLALTAEPPGPPPEGVAEDWHEAPLVELPDFGTAATSLPVEPPSPGMVPQPAVDGSGTTGDLPPAASFAPGDGGEAPAFVPGASSATVPSDAPPFNPGLPPAPADNTPLTAQAPHGTIGSEYPATPTMPDEEALPPTSLDPAADSGSVPQEPTAAPLVPAPADELPTEATAPPLGATDASDAVLPNVPESAPAATPTGDVATEFSAAMQTVQQHLDRGELAEAHLELSRWYDDPRLSAEQHQDLMRVLDRVAGTVVYSQQHHLLASPYMVQSGDTLESIATKFNVPWQLLAKVNGIGDPSELQPGAQLKIIPGPFDAVVDLDEFLLTLYVQQRYAGRFRIGVGQEKTTPLGEFVVQDKLENPTYYGPQTTIEADDPSNPLGERWIDLGGGIGIHGTNDSDSIGQAASRGCIRLSPADVVDVYDILSVGSRVVIRR